ncbi:TetR/AcrR family transcriptional regulator [Actinacidiphila acidipaludis]|uniref:TetR/AcrR family transcriptional regulator n=1 Tax=Actinacidiphila acidipaludis TaxID=2873382 RepID=A0ABS7Q5A8_9ACTN|nr:TetR/AcrR family transcriptional regulator [Streptomyces acidipaludis]MBY8877187.1 TetR/AcrR family transcriptional regulator [Streptomyces acidipaludis]
MRADAQRNYDRLLLEAKQAFIVHGTEVPLEDIARHAGVGVGTLYRHFPDRYALMNAVFVQEVEQITAQAEELVTAEDPTVALTSWLRAVAVHSTMYRGLSAAIMEASDSKMPACKTLLREAGGTLLRRAQEAGEVKSDLRIADLLKLTHAIVLAAEKTPDDRELFTRLMALAIDGMRVRPGGAAHGTPDPAAAAGATA